MLLRLATKKFFSELFSLIPSWNERESSFIISAIYSLSVMEELGKKQTDIWTDRHPITLEEGLICKMLNDKIKADYYIMF